MAFQLTISRRDLPPEDLLRRKPTLAFDHVPVTIGGPNADCPLDGLVGNAAVIRRQSKDVFVLMPALPMKLNGRDCGTDPQTLHSGDKIAVGDYLVQFHLCLEKARQSWQSAFLATFAKCVIVFIVFLIIGFMFVFTDMLRSSDRWDKYALQNKLTQRVDELRTAAKKVQKNADVRQLDKQLLERIQDELDSCARYVRANENRLTTTQVNDMLGNLNILETLLDGAQKGGMFPDLPRPSIDRAVTTILNNSKARN